MAKFKVGDIVTIKQEFREIWASAHKIRPKDIGAYKISEVDGNYYYYYYQLEHHKCIYGSVGYIKDWFELEFPEFPDDLNLAPWDRSNK